MLPPEIEEGNIEYKCFFSQITKERFTELSTQMNWRIIEGDGIAFYYIGIMDDGSVYNKLSSKQIKYSMNILKKLVESNNSSITKTEKNIYESKVWFKVQIKRNDIVKDYNEYRILLLGDTKSGKSTFIANLIKKKVDFDGKAKNYTFNHKHELVSGETSSINYYSIINGDDNFLFFDSPGNYKYTKTLLKMIQSIEYNLVLYFPNLDNTNWEFKDLYFNYFECKDTKIIELDLKSSIVNDFPKINIKELIVKEEFLKSIKSKLVLNKINDDKCIFNILNTYHNNELGWILSGYLVSGKITENQIVYWYNKNKIKVQIISIHDSISDKVSVKAPKTISLRVKIKDKNNDFNLKYMKYGVISSIENFNNIDKINIKWNKNFNSKKEIICNCINSKITIKLQDLYYKACNNFQLRNNLNDKYIVCPKEKLIGKISII